MPMRIGRSHAEVESRLRRRVDQRRFCDGAAHAAVHSPWFVLRRAPLCYGAVMLNVSGKL